MNFRNFQRTRLGALAALMAVLFAAWLLADIILQGTNYLLISLVMVAAAIVLFQTLKNWRNGVFLFLTWMLFEDLVRKNLGNNMVVYFAKDVLVAACFLGFYAAPSRKRVFSVRPEFLFPLACFFFWGLLEVFNPNSPSLWYGLLGLKLYFGYVPLFFLGYSLLQNESDLRWFLTLNLSIAGLISLLGVMQAVTGKVLLAPAVLAPDIQELGSLIRTAPLTYERFLRPPSVFVSDGRFGAYLVLAWLLGLGAGGYFFLKHLPGRRWVLLILGVIMAALVLSGVRGALMYALLSSVIIIGACVPEMLSRKVRANRIARALTATLLFATLSIVFLSVAYPEALGSRVAFYTQTLLPNSSASEIGWRVWGYPLATFGSTFDYPHWLLGYGTGTCSLGTQYVTRILGIPSANIGVESGYGGLILEMGIPGLLLWLAWTSTLIGSSWKVVRQLRGTPLFPLAFVIFLFSFITLVTSMATGLAIENYIVSAYLFLLSGILFSLPALAEARVAHERTLDLQQGAMAATPQRPVGESIPLPG